MLRGARVELASLAYETNDLPFVLPAMLLVFLSRETSRLPFFEPIDGNHYRVRKYM